MNLTETLTNAGLEAISAEIYLILVQNGEMTVPQVLEKTDLSRASVYEALSELLALGYAEYRKEGRNAFYKPVHPNKLFGLIEEKRRELSLFEGEMKNTIKSLIGEYNLVNNKPGVRFFEGEEGLKEALYHSLDEGKTIYTFVDSRTVERYAKKLDDKYVYTRIQKGIKKKIIMTDTPESKKYIKSMHTQLTEVRLINPEKYPFDIAVEIYGDNISYLSITEQGQIAFLIKNKNIAQFHESMFHYIWNTLPPLQSGNISRQTNNKDNDGEEKEKLTVFD